MTTKPRPDKVERAVQKFLTAYAHGECETVEHVMAAIEILRLVVTDAGFADAADVAQINRAVVQMIAALSESSRGAR